MRGGRIFDSSSYTHRQTSYHLAHRFDVCLDKATAENCCLQLTHYTLAVLRSEMDFVRLFLSSRLLIFERSDVGFAVHGYGKGGCDGWHVRVRCLGEITWTHAAGRCMRRIPMAEASSETSTARDKLQYLPSALTLSLVFLWTFSELRLRVCSSPSVCIALVPSTAAICPHYELYK